MDNHESSSILQSINKQRRTIRQLRITTTIIRKLKSLGSKVVLVNYDQISSDSSEFMLRMLSAITQEESANTSKRVKFGKKMNAEKGRVPNIVYGYGKIIGDFNGRCQPFLDTKLSLFYKFCLSN